MTINKEQLVLDTPIENFGLLVRTLNCVKRARVKTVWELTTYTERDLTRLKNFGLKSLNEIAEKLARFGLQIDSDPSREMIEILETRIQDLGLSHKMSGFLRSREIQTVEELIRRTPKQILHEIVNKLTEFGLQLKPDPPDTNKQFVTHLAIASKNQEKEVKKMGCFYDKFKPVVFLVGVNSAFIDPEIIKTEILQIMQKHNSPNLANLNGTKIKIPDDDSGREIKNRLEGMAAVGRLLFFVIDFQ